MTNLGGTRSALAWQDWSGSVLLHAALLLSVLWGLNQSNATLPKVTPLDMSIAWEAPRPPEPLAPPPPPPPQKTAPPRVQPAPAPVPQTAPVQPSPLPTTPLLAADSVVATLVAATKPATPAAPVAAAPPTPAAPNPNALAAQQARWHSVLEAALLKHKHYPLVARRMRQEGVVTIEAHFSAHGELLQCVVANGSGFKALDEAALQLVRQAAELVRATHQPGRVAQLRIPIVYELKET